MKKAMTGVRPKITPRRRLELQPEVRIRVTVAVVVMVVVAAMVRGSKVLVVRTVVVVVNKE
jgi:hypothetical protein